MNVAETLRYLELLEELERRPSSSSSSSGCEPVAAAEEWTSASRCYMCSGYYGPNFAQPACATCHAFLFPPLPERAPAGRSSASGADDADAADDRDSGNDEPRSHSRGRSRSRSRERRRPVVRAASAGELEASSLPPEVLLCVFAYLDDFSLCACSGVCRRWTEIVGAYVPPDGWRGFVARRWPLHRPLVDVDGERHFETYRRLGESCACHACLLQMAVRTRPVGEENSWRMHRLRNELKLMHNDPPEGIVAIPLEDKYCHWQATITGPKGSPYEGGLFYLYIQVSYNYPLSPPIVRFLTKILHPNVSRHGDVGIDSIHHNWSLALTIVKVLISVQSLLTDPYTEICMEPALGRLCNADRKAFERIARQWTWKHAMHDILIRP